MRTILIDVDTQHDFCAPDGALFVRGADVLVPSFRTLIARAVETESLIVGSVDTHAFDAWEFAGAAEAGPSGERPGFPPHCVKGTPGWLKTEGSLAPRARFVPNVPLTDDELRALCEKNQPQQILLEKEVYSLFANPNAARLLERVAERESVRFVVFGVALDYCVRAATLGLLDWLARDGRDGREGEVVLLAELTASVDVAGGEAALVECRARGARIGTLDDALAALASVA